MATGVGPHHIVVAGGGAAGLELVTKLGLTLGRTVRARIYGSLCCIPSRRAACVAHSTS
jgi:hypothetical protein